MEESVTSRVQLGFLLKPANLLKLVGSQVPFASIGTEILDQLDDHAMEGRVVSLEERVHLAAKIRALEMSSPPIPVSLHDWSGPTSEFLKRTVDVAVAYDSGFHARYDRGRELIQPVAHACITGEREILMCKEALDLVQFVASHKNGRCVILAGLAWYSFEAESTHSGTGLCLCRLTEKDEAKWAVTQRIWREAGLDELKDTLIATPVRHASSIWMGQEAGFVHCGEAEDVMSASDAYTSRQFDTCVFSHFRKLSHDALKMGVTSVLPGRITRVGAPVFSRDSTLLGIIADVEHYPSDAGRRAVIRSLLGHPRFYQRQQAQK